MRKSALDLVNDLLQADDSDVVSTIGETEEAGKALSCINRAYNTLLNEIDWEHRKVITRLDTASGTTTTWNPNTYPALPWVMKIPDNVESVYQVYYNQKKLIHVPKDEFQYTYINKLGLKTTGDPKYYTSWDDQYLVFENFDSDTETQLSSANSEILGVLFNTADLANDDDTPDMPDRFYSGLINLSFAYFLPKGEREFYFQLYERDRSYLKEWARRNKAFVPYYEGFDFSRKPRGTQLFQPDRPINDLGPS